MKENKIYKVAHVMMFLSVLVMAFVMYVPNVYAEDTITGDPQIEEKNTSESEEPKSAVQDDEQSTDDDDSDGEEKEETTDGEVTKEPTAPVEEISYTPVDKPVATTAYAYGEEITFIESTDAYNVIGTNKGTDAGEYTVTLTLNDGYEWIDNTRDDLILTYTLIEPTLSVEDIANKTYTGSTLTANLINKIKYGDKSILSSKCTVTYAINDEEADNNASLSNGKPLNAGSYIVTITYIPEGKDAQTVTKTFDIDEADLSKLQSFKSRFTEHNLDLVPTVKTGTSNSTLLVYGTDYEVDYQYYDELGNGISKEDVEVGDKVHVTITPIGSKAGNYKPCVIAMDIESDGASATRNGETVYYGTLLDAVNSITDDTETTVTLLKDDLDANGVKVVSGRNITFDFGGYEYKVTKNYVGSTGTETQGFQLLKDSTVVMKNGTLSINGYMGKMIIQNYSNLTLEDIIIDAKTNRSVLYALSNNNGVINIIGNTSIYVASGRRAFDVDWQKGSYPNGAQVTVDTTGTIEGIIDIADGRAYTEGAKSTLEIKNINHIGTINVQNGFENNVEITGGTFTSDPSAYVTEKYESELVDGVYTVVTERKAQIEDKKYGSLLDAINSVIDDTETIITLLVDDLDASGIVIPTGRNITIDFAGHTYVVTHKYAGSTNTTNQAFQLLKDSTIKMLNGIIKLGGSGGWATIQNYSNLTLTDMTLDATGSVYGAGAYALSSNNGQVLINGNTDMISDGVAFDMCWAPLQGYPAGTQIVVDTTGTIKGVIELDVWEPYKEDVKSTLEIRNINHEGTFSIDSRLADSLTILGGTYTTKPNTSNLGEGLAIAEGEVYTIVEGKAKIGDTYYANLLDAVNSVTDDTETTITLVSDDLDANGVKVVSGRNITIDFAGHTYVVTQKYAGSTNTTNQAFQLLKDSTIKMLNGIIKLGGSGGWATIQNYSNLTLTDMTLDATGSVYGAGAYALSSNNGQVLINGNTNMISDGVAFDMCWAPLQGYPTGTQIVVDTTGTIKGVIELDVWGTYEEDVKSTLEIKNIKHVGTFSIDSRLADSIAIKGGLFTTRPSDDSIANGYIIEEINNLYQVKVNEGTIIVEDDGEKYLYTDGNLVDFTGTKYIGSTKTRYMFINGKVDKTYTGIVDLGTKYVYLVNGETAKNYSGFLEFDGETYLFINGEASLNGSRYFGSLKKRYMFINGKVDKTYTGIVDLGTKYVYLVNGETAKNYSGILEFDGETYLFTNGEASFTGSKYIGTEKKRYIFVNGKVDKAVTSVVQVGNKYVYLINGETAKDYSGLLEYEGETYLFKNGEASLNGSQYFGSLKKRYMFVNGKVDKTYTGIVDLGTKYVYLVNGETAKDYNGLLDFEGETYLVRIGEANFNGSKYFGTLKKRLMFANGKLDKEFTGIVETTEAYVYLLNGMTDKEFNGPYLYNNDILTFKAGECRKI